ncbi:MAG: alpha-galactosidase, partial [Acidobacteria bacterium]|nr:alpha-galactosidase [Acidobacteriota bacterium]
ELGDYQADRAAFPNGIEELAAHVRKLGLKFGMWVEIENGGSESRLFAGHPEWFFQLGGKPLKSGERYHLDFAKPEVRAWARGVMDRLVRDYRLEWIKIDYNIDIGWEFDDPSGKGGVLMRHLAAYYRWLDEVRAAHPQLFLENCSSGGLRFDLGILRHTHSTWLSDEVKPRESVQLGYGCTVEFAPEVCNHWMVGDTDRGDIQPGAESGWWDFMLRVPMNGQYGISSKVFEWSPELKQRARANVALYKRIRPAIVGADVYHLTPPPDHNAPEGWTGIQYVAAGGRSVLMAYRCQGGEAERSFKLRGLDPSKTYRVRVDEKDRGVMTGAQLSTEGLKLELAEWRAAVVELE